MLHVLIVDDEQLVRTGIRYGVPWETYGMTIVAEANSVDEAISAIQKNQNIDIVFTDIVMPQKNGLVLLAWLKEHHPFITAVVLSYHNEFHYIQEALRLGTVDYIVKTELDNGKEKSTMLTIKERALLNKKNRLSLKKPLHQNTYLAAIGIVNIKKDQLTVSQTDIDAALSYYPISDQAGLFLFKNEIDDAQLDALVQNYSEHHIFLRFNTVQSDVTALMLRISLFISRDLFYEYLPNLKIYDIQIEDDISVQKIKGDEYMQIEQTLSSMQWIQEPDLLKDVLKKIRSAHLLPGAVYNLFFSVQMQWKRFFKEEKVPEMFPIANITYWYQWREYLEHFRTLIVTENKLSTYSPEVISAIQTLVLWLDENFYQNISLTEAAQKTAMSTSYLSRCFKEIIGSPFSQYVQELKISYAKKMLLRTNRPIKYIAEMCGFQDQFYFDKVFKKSVGVPPTIYRQNHINK